MCSSWAASIVEFRNITLGAPRSVELSFSGLQWVLLAYISSYIYSKAVKLSSDYVVGVWLLQLLAIWWRMQRWSAPPQEDPRVFISKNLVCLVCLLALCLCRVSHEEVKFGHLHGNSCGLLHAVSLTAGTSTGWELAFSRVNSQVFRLETYLPMSFSDMTCISSDISSQGWNWVIIYKVVDQFSKYLKNHKFFNKKEFWGGVF